MKIVSFILMIGFIIVSCSSNNLSNSGKKITDADRDLQNSKYAASKTDLVVCRVGTTNDGLRWEMVVPWYKAHANEAKSRGLSLEDCNLLTKKNKDQLRTEEIITSGAGDDDIEIIGSGN